MNRPSATAFDADSSWDGPSTLFDALDGRARVAPDRVAIVTSDTSVTYGDWRDAALEKAAGLAGLGVTPHDRVAVLTDNRADWLILAMASALLGARFIPYSTWATASELEFLLRHGRPKVLFVGDVPGQERLVDIVTECVPGAFQPNGTPHPGIPGLTHVFDLSRPWPTPSHSLAPSPHDVSRSSAAEPDDIAMVLYTSGSTASPKAVAQRHRDLLENGFHIGERLGLTDDDRIFLAVPLFWSYGGANALMAALTHGSTIVLQPRFESGEALSLIEKNSCTVIYTLPAMSHALFEHEDFALHRVESVARGLTIGPPSEVEFVANQLGIEGICNIYGSTEVYGNCCVTPHTAPLTRRARSHGPPLPGTEIQIATGLGIADQDETGGEIRVRGRVTPGYVREDGSVEPVSDADGWFHTGDTGYLDADGWLTFTGRTSEMIKTVGINVSPAEVEECLKQHPAVEEAAVTGAKHPIRGEQVFAFVRTRADSAVTQGELLHHCAQRLASYKVPVMIQTVRTLPLTSTGKIARRELKRLAETELAAVEGDAG